MSRSLLVGLGLAIAACQAAGCGKPSRPAATPAVPQATSAAQAERTVPEQSTAAADATQPAASSLDDLRKKLTTTDDSRTRVLTLD